MMFIKYTIKYSVLSFLFLGMFIFVPSVKAENLVDVEFEATPLFKDLNILPGDEVSKWVKVKNNSGEDQFVAVSVSSYTDNDNLGNQMNLVVSDGVSVLYSDTLTNFFNGGEQFLSIISNEVKKQYNFKISYLSDTDNDYQGKSLVFNIQIGVQARESIGGEEGGAGSSSGGGYIYNDLIISNEGVTVNNETATISWLTNKNATSRVIYDTVSHPDISGEAPSYYGYAFSNAEDSTKVTGHSMTILGLSPNTEYFFRPLSKASPEKYGKELSFTTTDSEEKVIVLGEEGIPDLELKLNCEKNIVNPGDEVVCKIEVNNNGSLAAYNVVLNDVLAEGLEFIESGRNKTWKLGDIDAGVSSSVEYLVLVDENINRGTYSNIAHAHADNFEEIFSEASLDVEKVSVLGIELPASGFSIKEFVFLLSTLFLLVFGFVFLKKKTKV